MRIFTKWLTKLLLTALRESIVLLPKVKVLHEFVKNQEVAQEADAVLEVKFGRFSGINWFSGINREMVPRGRKNVQNQEVVGGGVNARNRVFLIK